MSDIPTLGRARRSVERWWLAAGSSLWPWILVLGALALAATLSNAAGVYVFDNRFEQYWAPGQRLRRSVSVWDDTRGLGRIREDFWIGTTGPIWLMRTLGASPAIAERLWHALLLCTGGVGMVAVCRELLPRVGRWAGLAGLVYAFGPYSAVFLTPSVLYLHYALAPWLVVALRRGARGSHPWRWAALVALGLFVVGNTDPPGIVYGVVPATIAALHGLLVERDLRLGAVLGWCARVGVLGAATIAASVTKTVHAADAFAQRLETTEAFEVAATTSSWTETLRGLGFWLSYFRFGGSLHRVDEQPFFSEPWLVIATGVPAAVALVALWGARERMRWLLGAFLAVGGLLMVGAHPRGDPSPWGRWWLWAGDVVPGVASLRSTYKSGATLMLGVGALFALGAATAAARGPRRAVAFASVGVVVLGASPFWSNHLYEPGERLDGDVPAYWTEASEWLDRQPGDTRVLLAPGSSRTRYRWGSPGDDIHDVHLARGHVVDIPVALTTAAPADLIAAIDDALVDGRHRPGTVAPILRRIGVEYLVLRNDLDWERMGTPRPAAYSRLREDPELERVAVFGRRGQHVVGNVDRSTAAERRIHPVEVFRLVEPPRSVVRTAPTTKWTLLDGSGAGWFQAEAAGVLPEGSPVVYPATIDDARLAAQLRGGAPLVVTDTNRRRVFAVNAYDASRSHTLGAEEDLRRPVPDLFGDIRTQSVADHGDARALHDPTQHRAFAAPPEDRPAQAVDGDLTTGWVLPPIPSPTTRSLRIEFDRPVPVDGLTIAAFDPLRPGRSREGDAFAGVDRIARARLVLSTGEEHPFNMITGRAALSFPSTFVEWVEMRIDDVTGARSVGVAELQLSGAALDVREFIRLPTATFDRGDVDPALGRALRAATVHHLFERQVGGSTVPIENQLRRAFETRGDREYRLRGVAATRAPSGCADIGLRVDGRSILVRAGRGGDPNEFESCRPVEIEPGTHRLEGTAAILDTVVLSTGNAEPTEAVGRVGAVRRGDARRDVRIRSERPTMVITGDGYDDRWRARVDGLDLPGPMMLDTQTAWHLDGSVRPIDAEIRFGPARSFRIALVISFVGVAVSLAIVLGSLIRRRSR